MTKKYQVLLIGGLFTVAALSLVAGGYAIVKQPEEVFVHRMKLAQMSFQEEATFADAVAAIELQKENFLLKEIEFTSDRGNVTTSMQMLGAMPQTDGVEDYLKNFMTSASPLEKIQVFLFGKTLSTTVTVDPDQLKLAFADKGIEQGLNNAEFIYSDGQVQIKPEQIGYGIDVDALTALVQNYWTNSSQMPSAESLPLRTSQPEIKTADLQILLPTAETLAGATVVLQDEYGTKWKLPMADHLAWLIPEGTSWALDENQFITYVETDLVPDIEEDPQPATITENADGTYAFEGSARFGRAIDKVTLMEDIRSSLEANSTDPVSIPILQTQPQITVPDSLKERGITQLVGVGYSTYKTSPKNRIANVNHGFQKFNGVIVEQGTEFSFTDLMGPIDAAHGWLPELVIKGKDTIPEYGGGMCQVSSTMFRAALYSGLPITARTNHSYAVSYYAYPYGYGLDATVYDPNPNLKFINDTPGDILIQGYTDGFDAYFVFYGTNDGRSVKMEGPYSYDYTSISQPEITYVDTLAPGERQLEEYGHTGFKVDWYRTVTYPTSSTSPYAATASGVKETIHSDYEARPAKYIEGAGTTGE